MATTYYQRCKQWAEEHGFAFQCNLVIHPSFSGPIRHWEAWIAKEKPLFKTLLQNRGDEEELACKHLWEMLVELHVAKDDAP